MEDSSEIIFDKIDASEIENKNSNSRIKGNSSQKIVYNTGLNSS
jgi:hypothetical protein